MHTRAAYLISTLGLAPHPEGGYFREVYRAAASVQPLDDRSARAALTTIYFLLAAGQISHWHRVASDEAWHFYEGDPLNLFEADENFDHVAEHLLGIHDVHASPVHIIPAGAWQAARSTGAYTLVGCTVGPGFDFSDFELLEPHSFTAEHLRDNHPELAMFVYPASP